MKIFFSVGEPSGDLHGANLIRELRQRQPQLSCVGYGGPQMAAAGCQLHQDLTQFAIMWFWRVLCNLHRFFVLWRQADNFFREQRPDAVVLIDYPGFNWWIARSAKKYQIPVFYYGVPQMWAWAGWRIKKMRRYVDHVLCKLPFEVEWFRQRGCAATYVGHPYFDEVSRRSVDRTLVDQLRGNGSAAGRAATATNAMHSRLVTLLPGSRTQEVLSNLPAFLATAAHVRSRVPQTRFAVAAFNTRQAELARAMVAKSQLPIDVHVARTAELIEAAHCCLACSGSVSLELLYLAKPTVIHYRVSRLALFAQSLFRRVKYITLVNLLATDQLFPEKVTLYDPDAPGAEPVPFPEYLTCVDKSAAMAEHLISWLTDDRAWNQRVEWLTALKQQVGVAGASATAAEYILSRLVSKPATGHPRVPPPHFDTRHAA